MSFRISLLTLCIQMFVSTLCYSCVDADQIHWIEMCLLVLRVLIAAFMRFSECKNNATNRIKHFDNSRNNNREMHVCDSNQLIDYEWEM